MGACWIGSGSTARPNGARGHPHLAARIRLHTSVLSTKKQSTTGWQRYSTVRPCITLIYSACSMDIHHTCARCIATPSLFTWWTQFLMTLVIFNCNENQMKSNKNIGKLFAAGGFNHDGTSVAGSVECLNLETKSWEEAADPMYGWTTPRTPSNPARSSITAEPLSPPLPHLPLVISPRYLSPSPSPPSPSHYLFVHVCRSRVFECCTFIFILFFFPYTCILKVWSALL